MSEGLALALLTTSVLNTPAMMAIFRRLDHVDDVNWRLRRLSVTFGTVSLLGLLGGATASAWWLLRETATLRPLTAAVVLAVVGIAPFVVAARVLYEGYADAFGDD